MGSSGKYIGITTEPIPSQVYDQLLWSLILTPGSSDHTYDLTTLTTPTENFSMAFKSSNALVLGVSTDASANVTLATSIYGLTALNAGNTYTLDHITGTSFTPLIGLSCLEDPIFPNTYNIDKLAVSTSGTAPKVVQVMGTQASSLFRGQFKSWRLMLGPKDTISDMSLGFTDKDGVATTFNNIRFNTIFSTSIKDAVIEDGLSYASSNIFNIIINEIPSPYPYVWQKLLADTTFKYLISGTNPAVVAQETLGPVAVNTSLTTTVVFRNVTNTPIVVTEVVVANTTLSIASVKTGALYRDKVAADFAVSINGTPVAALTGAVLSRIEATNITLLPLEEVSFTVIYTPTLKITPSSAMISPYVSTTAVAIANSVNTNRRLTLTVKSSTGVLGVPLTIKGAVL